MFFNRMAQHRFHTLNIAFNFFIALLSNRNQNLRRKHKANRGRRQTKDPFMFFSRLRIKLDLIIRCDQLTKDQQVIIFQSVKGTRVF